MWCLHRQFQTTRIFKSVFPNFLLYLPVTDWYHYMIPLSTPHCFPHFLFFLFFCFLESCFCDTESNFLHDNVLFTRIFIFHGQHVTSVAYGPSLSYYHHVTNTRMSLVWPLSVSVSTTSGNILMWYRRPFHCSLPVTQSRRIVVCNHKSHTDIRNGFVWGCAGSCYRSQRI